MPLGKCDFTHHPFGHVYPDPWAKKRKRFVATPNSWAFEEKSFPTRRSALDWLDVCFSKFNKAQEERSDAKRLWALSSSTR